MNNVSPKLTISSNHKELGYSENLILESIQTLCEHNANFEEVINCKSINISFVSQQEIKELNKFKIISFDISKENMAAAKTRRFLTHCFFL